MCFFFKPKTAYELRISDWSSDVCSSDLEVLAHAGDFVLRRSRSRSAQAIPCTISRMQKAGISDFSRKEAGIPPTEMEPSSTAQELRTDGLVDQANSSIEGSRKPSAPARSMTARQRDERRLEKMSTGKWEWH